MHDHAAGHGAVAHDEPADTYTCPMHPDIVQNEPGNCPTCGMTLVRTGSSMGHGAHGVDMMVADHRKLLWPHHLNLMLGLWISLIMILIIS